MARWSLCPGKKSGCRPWWPHPGSGARRLSPSTRHPGPITVFAALKSRGLPDQRGVPRVGGVKAHPDDTGLLPLLASGSISLGDDGAGQFIQAGRQGSHDIGGQERGHQQVAVLGEGAPLPTGELGLPGHGAEHNQPVGRRSPGFSAGNLRTYSCPLSVRAGHRLGLVKRAVGRMPDAGVSCPHAPDLNVLTLRR
jgi:hypothetical protein